jgi:single-strand DNA-binding protein
MSNNTFQFIGNLTSDAEIKTAKTLSILNFRLAVSDGYGEKKFTDYHTCKAFGKTAEYNANLKKGDRIMVMGRVKSNSYEKDGKKVYATDFIADRVYRIAKVDMVAEPTFTADFGAPMPADMDDDLPF